MPRDLKAHENRKRARARRDGAIKRLELGIPTTPREPAAGATSFALKARDPAEDAMVAEFLERKKGDR